MIIPSQNKRPSLWSRLTRRNRQVESAPSALMDPEAFLLQIRKECFRADRRNIEFCLGEFLAGNESLTPDKLDFLFEIFQGRLRLTDELGLFQGNLSALLPDTPEAGAYKIANELVDLAGEHGLEINFEISVYPDDFPADLEAGGQDSTVSRKDKPGNQKISGKVVNANTNGANTIKFYRSVPKLKRLFDFSASLCGLLVFSPFMLAAAVAIKASSKGPILFLQRREGKDGVPFTIIKFRTMVVDAEEIKKKLMHLNEQDGPAFKIEEDPRLTNVGRVIRKYCIDELPQLFNVLRGEMSMVGPRPLPVVESVACERWQRRRLNVLPGMTCYWQVDGGREVSFDDWMRMDLQYIDDASMKVDLKLLYDTARVALLGRGSV